MEWLENGGNRNKIK